MQEARSQGVQVVFALSIDARVLEFFKELGFRDIERARLPAQWREHYDMSRPSKALVRNLG
jgi:N-acetylglutamate synthase-like GNAT family acetyltransferase